MTNARIAGFTYLFYIAVALPCMFLMSRATNAEGTLAKLAIVAQHAIDVRLTILLTLLSCFSAIVLGIALYGVTRDEDHELSLMAMAFRVSEGVLGAIGIPNLLGLLWVSTSGAGPAATDPVTTSTLGAYFLMPAQDAMIGAPFFAAGSLIFSFLLLRGRMIPSWLAWLGIIASALVVVASPLQIAGFIKGPFTSLMWLPMLAFEVPLGLWLLIKGVAKPTSL